MPGRVVLVGGGPGAADLITVRGLERLRAADVVIVDRLAPTGLLANLAPGVEIIDAARQPERRALRHEQIVALMIEHARAGRTVVRLKGGDPFVFAHGGQEVAACAAAGVAVEVVPGLSSATAAATLAGRPLTVVGGAAGFSVITGHLAPDDPDCTVGWDALVAAATTIVVLMGMRRLAAITGRLHSAGMPADTPAHCITEASLPTERTVSATLGTIAEAAAAAGLSNPAVVIIEAGAARRAARRILVLGGARSGKSAFAESLLDRAAPARYLAASAADPDDPEWARRVARHRARRPAGWRTVAGLDIAAALREPHADPALLDSATTWLAGVLDRHDYWTRQPPTASTQAKVDTEIDTLLDAWSDAGDAAAPVIAVSDEIGSGVVPASPSGRSFRDLLGELNQRLAAGADAVYLVTAGIAQRLR